MTEERLIRITCEACGSKTMHHHDDIIHRYFLHFEPEPHQKMYDTSTRHQVCAHCFDRMKQAYSGLRRRNLCKPEDQDDE